jgi:hypothetical protein
MAPDPFLWAYKLKKANYVFAIKIVFNVYDKTFVYFHEVAWPHCIVIRGQLLSYRKRPMIILQKQLAQPFCLLCNYVDVK